MMPRCPTSFGHAIRTARRVSARAGPLVTRTLHTRAAKRATSRIFSKPPTITSALDKPNTCRTDLSLLRNCLQMLAYRPASSPQRDLTKNSRRFISMADNSIQNSCHSATLQSNSATVFRCRQNIQHSPIMQENFHPFFP